MDPNQQALDPQAVNLAKAIRQTESGGDFNARGKSGEFGAYQFTIPIWTKTAQKYGVNVPLPQATKEQQNEVAYKQVKEWKDAGYNVGQISSMWNAGEGKPNAYLEGNKGVNKQGVKYDTAAYAKSVAAAYQTLKKGGEVGMDPQNPSSISGAQQNASQEAQPSMGGFLGNVVSSGANLIGGVAHAITHPIETGRNLVDLGVGGVENAIQGGANLLGIKGNGIQTPEMDKADAVAQFYKDRYGGIENIKNTLYKDPVGVAADASVLLGGAGAALGKVGEVADLARVGEVGSALTKIGDVADPLKLIGRGVGGVKSTIGKGTTAVGDALTPIDEGVVNTLKPQNINPNMSLTEQAMSKQKNLSDLNRYMEQAKKSVANYSEDNALKLASQKAEEAVSKMDKQLSLYGKTKEMALQRIAGKPVDLGRVKDSFASIVEQRTGARFTKGGFLTTPRGQFSTLASATDKGLLTDTYGILKKLGDNPTAFRVDRAVDALQARLDYAGKNLYEPVNSQVEVLVKSTVKDLNSRVQSLDDNYRLANKGYSDTIETRNELNKALGLHANKGASLLKRVFSLTDGGTKTLFDQVKTKTGIDLIREATLAKFAMENAGDYRQANLLEQLLNAGKIPTNTTGLIQKAGEFVLDKAVERSPGNKAIRMLGGKPSEPAISRLRRTLNSAGNSLTPIGETAQFAKENRQ